MQAISPLCSSRRVLDFDDMLSSPSYDDDEPPMVEPGEFLQDQIVALLHTEESYAVFEVPCLYQRTSASKSTSYDGWRRAICEWSYRVVDHFQVSREAVGVALNLLDRYLASGSMNDSTNDATKSTSTSSCHCPKCQRSVSSRTFQLAAMTALYVAVKLHHTDSTAEELYQSTEHVKKVSRRKKLRLLSFVDLSRGQFSTADITNMELKMLRVLEWKVHPPTPATLVTYLLQLLPMQRNNQYNLTVRVLQEIARYLAELSVCLSDLGGAPSDVAFAAILGGIDLLQEHVRLQVDDEFHHIVTTLRCQFELEHISTTPKFNAPRALFLKVELLRNFSPEMLLEDCANDSQHPIAVALQQGLLGFGLSHPSSPSSSCAEFRTVQRKASATSVIIGIGTRPDPGDDDWMRVAVTP